MSGTGNDFVIIDNREPVIEPDQKRPFVKKVCARKTSVGADGVIFIENSDRADFRWDFYNSDGSTAEMCGNGGRCVARYAFEHGIASRRLSFETLAGIITAEVDGASVKVRLSPPHDARQDMEIKLENTSCLVDALNTGVPHAIIYSDDVNREDIPRMGRGIRFHEAFVPAGTNVNWVQVLDPHALKIRTYERGVEGETLACGTGAVAAALLAARRDKVEPPIRVETRGGESLTVHFQKPANGSFGDVFLEGMTKTTFGGTILEL